LSGFVVRAERGIGPRASRAERSAASSIPAERLRAAIGEILIEFAPQTCANFLSDLG